MTARFRLGGMVLAAGLVGCGPTGRVKEEIIEIQPQKGLEQAKQLLENYAKGQPLGSEVTSYQYLITEVTKEDPDRGAILEKGLAELEKTKGAATAAKAKELLRQLAPKQSL